MPNLTVVPTNRVYTATPRKGEPLPTVVFSRHGATCSVCPGNGACPHILEVHAAIVAGETSEPTPRTRRPRQRRRGRRTPKPIRELLLAPTVIALAIAIVYIAAILVHAQPTPHEAQHIIDAAQQTVTR